MYLTSLPANQRAILHEIWGRQAWFLCAYIRYGGEALQVVLQRKPFSGKIPDSKDVYDEEIPLSQSHGLKTPWVESVAEGNPGATRVLNDLKSHCVEERDLTFESALFWLLANNITGPELWKAYTDLNDNCIESLANKIVVGWSMEPLPYSPDNLMVSTNMPREKVKRDPLHRFTEPTPE